MIGLGDAMSILMPIVEKCISTSIRPIASTLQAWAFLGRRSHWQERVM